MDRCTYTGKVQHRSAFIAEKVASKMKEMYNERFSYFQCWACGNFHVGHTTHSPADIPSDEMQRLTKENGKRRKKPKWTNRLN